MDSIEAILKAMIDRYEEDLIKACLTYDVKELKAHIAKYKALGYFPDCYRLPTDDVLNITMRKIVFNSNLASPADQAEAGTWLIENGYDLYLD